MKKVIALLPNGYQILTTPLTATKNKYWITYNVEVVLAAPETDPSKTDNKTVPKVGMLIKGFGGYIYQLTKVDPLYICFDCYEKGANRIGNSFYCNCHFKKHVVTDPIKRVDEKIHRNAPCICGSGKKFKRCCLPKQEIKGGHYYNSEYKRREQIKKTA